MNVFNIGNRTLKKDAAMASAQKYNYSELAVLSAVLMCRARGITHYKNMIRNNVRWEKLSHGNMSDCSMIHQNVSHCNFSHGNASHGNMCHYNMSHNKVSHDNVSYHRRNEALRAAETEPQHYACCGASHTIRHCKGLLHGFSPWPFLSSQDQRMRRTI